MSSPRFAGQVELTFGHIERLISSLPAPPRYRELLLAEIQVARREAAEVAVFPPIDFPFALAASVAAPEQVLVPTVAATTFVYLGADLLDNIMDAELPADWQRWSSSQVLLAASTMLSALWAVAVDGIPTRAVPRGAREKIRHSIVEGLLAMSHGQFLDLEGESHFPEGLSSELSELAAVRGTAELKSGRELGMCGAVVAATVSADDRIIDCATKIGTSYGTAVQIASDLGDLFDPRGSRDLAAGTYTLPLAHARRCGTATRCEVDRAWAAARNGDLPARNRLQDLLVSSGSVQYCALVISLYSRSASRLTIELAKEFGGTADAVLELFESLTSIGRGRTDPLAKVLP